MIDTERPITFVPSFFLFLFLFKVFTFFLSFFFFDIICGLYIEYHPLVSL